MPESPVLFEFLTLLILASGGVSLALLVGIRDVISLAVGGFLFSAVLRFTTALTSWNLELEYIHAEIWWFASASLVLLAAVLKREFVKEALISIAILLTIAILGLASKYLFQFGERHHTDSAEQLSLALIAIQPDEPALEMLSGSHQRGLLYALMLALGPDGRILSAYTPMVFMVGVLATIWLIWITMPRPQQILVSVGLLGLGAMFAFSVPIIRVSVFYLNAHTLVALGLVSMALGMVQISKDVTLNPQGLALITGGGIVVVTSRIEGIVFVAVAIAAILSQTPIRGTRNRLYFFASIGLIPLALGWWLSTVDSDALSDLGVPLAAVVVVPLALLAGSLLPVADRVRTWSLPIAIAVVIGGNAIQIMRSSNPLEMLTAQVPNLLFGAGGWGTAALVVLGVCLLSVDSMKDPVFRLFFLLSVGLIAAIFLSKSFEGGFGREGFNDSVNRMYLHSMWIVIVTVSLGLMNSLKGWTNQSRSASREKAHHGSQPSLNNLIARKLNS